MYIVIWDEVKFIFEIGLFHFYLDCNEMIKGRAEENKTLIWDQLRGALEY